LLELSRLKTFLTVIQDYFCLYIETPNSRFTIGSRNLNVIWLFFEPFLLNLNSFSKTQKLDFSFPKYILEVVFILLFSHKCLDNCFYCVYNPLNVLIPRYLWSRKTCCRQPWKWHHRRFSNRIPMYLFNHSTTNWYISNQANFNFKDVFTNKQSMKKKHYSALRSCVESFESMRLFSIQIIFF